MDWKPYLNGFIDYLKLEKALSHNSIDAYKRDLNKLTLFLTENNTYKQPEEIDSEDLHLFSQHLGQLGISPRSQSRVISGIKSFFKYLIMEDLISKSPAEFLEGPRLGRKLPETLSIEEVKAIISAVDLSKAEGERNKTILHLLYGCGLRVSELIDLQISNINFNDKYIIILGKGNKERLVPVGNTTLKSLHNYLIFTRNHKETEKETKDLVFLNNRGRKLSRQMIFLIIKDLTEKAGIEKKVSPHSFRHSFATHMVDGGADLRAIQQMLGHQSIETTEIYTHISQDLLAKTIDKYHPLSLKR
ncbi:MAG: site-specific tyrosine recombinase XerD [Hyphomicrobiales bacterium]